MNCTEQDSHAKGQSPIIVGDGHITLEDMLAVAFDVAAGATFGRSVVAGQAPGGPPGH